MTKVRIEVGNAGYLRAASCFIRMEVFVRERALAMTDEFDQNDTPDTVYSVLFLEDLPVATARFLLDEEGTARIGRVATQKDYRGKQLGRQAVTALEIFAKEKQTKQVLIHAELTAAAFYEQLGYVRMGERYEEDGVPCITLVKKL
ncbi:hypothetical protein IGI66_000466 [Enterococcus sp. AZ048]|uniref:GNAT family N-acetyltransferase n=1 Tax=Enterococcus sp. AZ048 TaxID=2774658 RepID=UPI003F26ACA5